MDRTKNSITILGSGTSTGVPMVACDCPVCTSANSKNRRLRTSFYLQTPSGKSILVETTPDLRQQLLGQNIQSTDAVVISHTHADHLHGIDDLRPLCFGPPVKKIPVYCAKKNAKEIKKRFPYIFDMKPLIGGGIPLIKICPVPIKKYQLTSLQISGEELQFFLLPHGRCQSMGFIHKSLVYIPDCSSIPSPLLDQLKEIKPDLLLITCLQEEPHDTHLNINCSFEYIKKIAPKQAVLVHMNHHLEHEELHSLARESFNFPVAPAFDGAKYYY